MQFVQTTGSKVDFDDKTPDTDLRREYKYSEPQLVEARQLLDSPEPAQVSLREIGHMKHAQHHIDEPSIRSGGDQDSQTNLQSILKMESPSPHKQSNFKNLEPEQKSRTTGKQAHSEMAFSGQTHKNGGSDENRATGANQSFGNAMAGIVDSQPQVTSEYDSTEPRLSESNFSNFGSPEIGDRIGHGLQHPMGTMPNAMTTMRSST